tara:strand:+ start:2268 stop:2405 length:138 start_codon:yes stop_codon:yes gene_type:complete
MFASSWANFFIFLPGLGFLPAVCQLDPGCRQKFKKEILEIAYKSA